MSYELQKPVIGFTCGDLNGIGIELIIKTLSDHRILEICTPVVFANNKCINFYRKTLPENNFSYANVKELNRLNPKQVNIFNCWEEEVVITPGQLNEIGGKYALESLTQATQALKEGLIHGLVTAPIHKKNIHTEAFPYTGHTPYFKAFFNVSDVVMFMVAENMRVGLVTEHVTVADVSKHITRENILLKLKIMHNSLQKDFGVDKPKIAVLGLNPHAGDEGLIGAEEETIIKPAIKDAKQSMLVFGPYSADAFFARGQFEKFDAVLAMYHDQGLIPFKSLAIGEGVNYTAGLPVIRTSPDHGTAFDIAGKDKADANSFIVAVFEAVDIYRSRNGYKEMRANPLRKMSARMLANAVDERIEENEG
ncbi:MAG: 4-hydroxythreonine-4-phosphate dehydrogenase PdxA [Bacteroidetes bacterium 24-39-8]|jgi:4-hydroxythreonine-4-phosphate dehydrogenase|nr:MAG: 4-hydroxythreonine-4-phosphate dehydrogenase PdxA [Sphingobacteriia bacterium 35-40-8]OYZ50504.1 MAG: 4-hydroxythreonine-4-phosphate dehydrogenase PdxA [Bacteroidetes bacterium 24-39-8]OZA62391.1 MAG: 4-hydroxythreonine-4-phosphate dehydrogenase PdxA [Sphingobacteriia bacterium 39-39-8]HQR93771.1 4-hydroxythreonine-4-phosphate dehydrogenase PdxA [Sediminibacterium sp.]HQS54061.1 4-hydroxythreonine-4-phosphate dehydrogenase PdxA [Sediminibacterium sp.]